MELELIITTNLMKIYYLFTFFNTISIMKIYNEDNS